MLTRRQFAAAPAFLRAFSKSKPNLLLLMTDQHRGDCIGSDGNRVIRTPNLDSIANRGVRFRHAYSSTPSCTPARAGLLTGMSPWRHGMLGYGRVAEKYPAEMPRILRDAGYYTTGIGKMHWFPQRNPHGFHQTILDESGRAATPDFRSDYRAWFASEAPNLGPDATGIGWNDYTAKPYVLPERLHPTRWTGDVATRFIDTYTNPQSFFLKVSFARPHSPYDAPQRFWDQYSDAPLPKAQVGKWAAKYAPRNGPKDDIWHGAMGEAAVRNARTGYYGNISFVDEQVGRILESLQKRRLLDETLILFLSDHGDMTGDNNLWRKTYAYEPSARIPILLAGPGVPRGAVNRTPVEIRDVLPTFAQAAGASLPGGCDGQSLFTPSREFIDLEHDVCYDKVNHWTALTDGKWKYIFDAYDGSEQLFNLEQDPHELTESGDAAALRLWRARMVAHLEPRGERWVANGRLRVRPESMLYGVNYPKADVAAGG